MVKSKPARHGVGRTGIRITAQMPYTPVYRESEAYGGGCLKGSSIEKRAATAEKPEEGPAGLRNCTCNDGLPLEAASADGPASGPDIMIRPEIRRQGEMGPGVPTALALVSGRRGGRE